MGMDEVMELYEGWPISFLSVVDGIIIHVQLESVNLERRNVDLVYFPHVVCFVSFMC